MAEYTEADIQNALANIANGILATTVAKVYKVLYTILYSRISGSQHYKTAHFNMQRLSPVQEDHLATWILRQEALNYAPTHAQVRAITTSILKQAGDY